jgi:hypothetical protein
MEGPPLTSSPIDDPLSMFPSGKLRASLDVISTDAVVGQHGTVHVAALPRTRQKGRLGPQDLQVHLGAQPDLLSLDLGSRGEASHPATEVAQTCEMGSVAHSTLLAPPIPRVRLNAFPMSPLITVYIVVSS